MGSSDAGRWKTLGVPVVIGGDNLPSTVGIELTDLPNIGGASGPLGLPGSGITGWEWLQLTQILPIHPCECGHFSLKMPRGPIASSVYMDHSLTTWTRRGVQNTDGQQGPKTILSSSSNIIYQRVEYVVVKKVNAVIEWHQDFLYICQQCLIHYFSSM